MPKLYEAMYVVLPDVSEDELAAVMQRAADTVTQVGAAVELNEVWDRRELAYEIDRVTRGIYCLMYFEAEGTVVEVLRRELELDEQVVRAGVFVANPKTMWRPPSPEAPAEEKAAEGEAEEEEAVAEGQEPGQEPAEPEPAPAEEPAEAAASEETKPSEEGEADQGESAGE